MQLERGNERYCITVETKWEEGSADWMLTFDL
jgi:hypothetical protein